MSAFAIATLVLSPGGFGIALPDPGPGAGPILVTGTLAYENGSFQFDRHHVILPGATLVIRNASVSIAAPDENCVEAGAALRLCLHAFLVHAGGSLVIERSVLDSAFDDPALYPTIMAIGGTVEARDSTFSRFWYAILQQPGPQPHLFAGNTFTEWSGGLGFWRGAEGLVEGNLFLDQDQGMGAQDASPTIRHNTFQVIGRALRVQQSLVGDKASEVAPYLTRPVVEGNTFIGGHIAIFTDAGTGFPIRNNTFRDQPVSIGHRVPTGTSATSVMLHVEPARIEANRFENVGTALNVFTQDRVPALALSTTLRFEQNAVEGPLCRAIVATSGDSAPLVVDARDNWWGSPEGPVAAPGCDPFVGDVVVEPWLTAPPPA